MAEKYDMGTPVGADRKYRRIQSPLQEMDGVVGRLDVSEDDQGPQTPREAHLVTNNSPVTLQAMSDLLDSKFGPVQKQIAELELKLKDHQDCVALEIKRIMTVVEGTIDGLTVRMAKLEDMSAEGKNLMDRVMLLEKELRALQGSSSPQTRDQREDRDSTAVIGGLNDFTHKDDAAWWLSDQLWQQYGPQVSEFYCKGAFKGMVFAKFRNKDDRDAAMRALNMTTRRRFGSNQISLCTIELHVRCHLG